MMRLGMRTSSIFNSQHAATRCNMVAKREQHVAPNNIAICCVEMLRRNVAIVWSGLENSGPTMLRYVASKCCNRLARASNLSKGKQWEKMRARLSRDFIEMRNRDLSREERVFGIVGHPSLLAPISALRHGRLVNDLGC